MRAKPVVVGIDGSEGSRAALTWAAQYATKFDLPLKAVTTWELYYAYHDVYPGMDLDQGMEESARKALTRTVLSVLGEKSSITQLVVRGKPAHVLLDAAKSAALLVVGSRGHGAFAGMLLGSVSQHCVHHAPCPVVVVPVAD